MSAFVVQEECIRQVVEAIKELSRWNTAEFEFAGVKYDPSDTRSLGKLGQALFSMNCAAVDQRYEETNAIPLYKHQTDLGMSTPEKRIQRMKYAQSLRYQCSEGNVPQSELYKALDAFIGAYAEQIVGTAKEYDAANWG